MITNFRETVGKPIATMPKELILFLKEWDIINPSPYNKSNRGSFYNVDNIGWKCKPEGSLRVSDHWNFEKKGEMHCITNIPVSGANWTVAEYKNGMYYVVSTYEKQKKKPVPPNYQDFLNALKRKRKQVFYEKNKVRYSTLYQ